MAGPSLSFPIYYQYIRCRALGQAVCRKTREFLGGLFCSAALLHVRLFRVPNACFMRYNKISPMQKAGRTMSTITIINKTVSVLVPALAQGTTNDLLYCLLLRDSETNKQIFQLLMDRQS